MGAGWLGVGSACGLVRGGEWVRVGMQSCGTVGLHIEHTNTIHNVATNTSLMKRQGVERGGCGEGGKKKKGGRGRGEYGPRFDSALFSSKVVAVDNVFHMSAVDIAFHMCAVDNVFSHVCCGHRLSLVYCGQCLSHVCCGHRLSRLKPGQKCSCRISYTAGLLQGLGRCCRDWVGEADDSTRRAPTAYKLMQAVNMQVSRFGLAVRR